MASQQETRYGLRALIELAMLRYKTIIGPKLKARKLSQQKNGSCDLRARVKYHDWTRYADTGTPISV